MLLEETKQEENFPTGFNGRTRDKILDKGILSTLFLVAILSTSGCIAYCPSPLTSEKAKDALKPPDREAVWLRADSIRHPLLPPVLFDYRDGLSPDEAAILAVAANPTLRAARNERGIAAAQLLEAGILPNPKLSLDLERPAGGDREGKVDALGIGLTWKLSSLFTRRAGMAAAGAHADAVDLDVAWQEWQAAEGAKLRLYELLLATRRFKVAQQSEAAFGMLQEGIKEGVEMGVNTALDFATAAAGLQEARMAAVRAKSEMKQAQIQLNHALGLPAEETVLPEERTKIPCLKELPSAEELASGIEERRLDLLALKSGYRSQEARVRAAIRSRFPQISLGLTGARDTDGLETVGIGLNIDLPFFNRSQGRIAAEEATRRQLFDEYAARFFDAKAAMAGIVSAIQSVRNQMTALNEAISALKTLAERCRKGTAEGLVDLMTYYRTLSTLHAKQLERVELDRKLIDLGVALEIASGRYGLLTGGGCLEIVYGDTGGEGQ